MKKQKKYQKPTIKSSQTKTIRFYSRKDISNQGFNETSHLIAAYATAM